MQLYKKSLFILNLLIQIGYIHHKRVPQDDERNQYETGKLNKKNNFRQLNINFEKIIGSN